MYKEIYFAAGCFWGAEKYLKLIRGVISTEVGFANGNTPDPTYKEVYTDTTGYAECVHVTYDPQVIPVDKLTRIYFKAIDPTSLNKQGEDEGTRYRTGVYYTPDTDSSTVEILQEVFSEQQQALEPSLKLAVELLPLKNFYRAEEYHQDYLDKNPTGYCHLTPALFRLAAESN
ncbi:MAG: peptide-methionine (S)-S-oxide reductase MsrA [Bacteroidaceae bacterium]|nr:peptide-methionine (S)-S-oxide reductase MsrA [Bacteroidaceae bacterium]